MMGLKKKTFSGRKKNIRNTVQNKKNGRKKRDVRKPAGNKGKRWKTGTETKPKQIQKKEKNGIKKNQKRKKAKKAVWDEFLSNVGVSIPTVTRNMSKYYKAWEQCLISSNEDRLDQLHISEIRFPYWHQSRGGIVTRAVAKKIDHYRKLTNSTTSSSSLASMNTQMGTSTAQSRTRTKSPQGGPIWCRQVASEPCHGHQMISRSRKFHLRKKVLSYICPEMEECFNGGVVAENPPENTRKAWSLNDKMSTELDESRGDVYNSNTSCKMDAQVQVDTSLEFSTKAKNWSDGHETGQQNNYTNPGFWNSEPVCEPQNTGLSLQGVNTSSGLHIDYDSKIGKFGDFVFTNPSVPLDYKQQIKAFESSQNAIKPTDFNPKDFAGNCLKDEPNGNENIVQKTVQHQRLIKSPKYVSSLAQNSMGSFEHVHKTIKSTGFKPSGFEEKFLNEGPNGIENMAQRASQQQRIIKSPKHGTFLPQNNEGGSERSQKAIESTEFKSRGFEGNFLKDGPNGKENIIQRASHRQRLINSPNYESSLPQNSEETFEHSQKAIKSTGFNPRGFNGNFLKEEPSGLKNIVHRTSQQQRLTKSPKYVLPLPQVNEGHTLRKPYQTPLRVEKYHNLLAQKKDTFSLNFDLNIKTERNYETNWTSSKKSYSDFYGKTFESSNSIPNENDPADHRGMFKPGSNKLGAILTGHSDISSFSRTV